MKQETPKQESPGRHETIMKRERGVLCGDEFGRGEVSALLSEYVGSGRFREDFDSLEPSRRITLFERLLPYAVAKLKSVDADEVSAEREPEIEDIILSLVRGNVGN